MATLEQQCLALAVEVRELKQRHQEKLTEQETQHVVQVSQVRTLLVTMCCLWKSIYIYSSRVCGFFEYNVALLCVHKGNSRLVATEW